MAVFSFNIPDGDVSRVVNAFAYHYEYREEVANPAYDALTAPDEPKTIPNPISKAQFTRQKVRDYIKGVVRAGEEALAAIAAKAAVADVDITEQ